MKRKSNQSVCFSIIGHTNTYWYTFDISNEGEDDRLIAPCRCNCGCPCAKRIRYDTTRATPSLSPVKVLPKEVRDNPGWTVVGNQLYRLGGSFRDGWVVSKTVRALDLTTNNGSSSNGKNNTPRWQRKARMLVPRSAPATVVVGGKIYVLGGYMLEDNADDTPWAEVYDPTSNIWEALPPPPEIPQPRLKFGCDFGYQFFSAGLEDDNDGEKGSIIVLSVPEDLLLQYNVANKSWNMDRVEMCGLETWSGEPPGRIVYPGGPPAVAVGRMVYWFSGRTGCLYGFHIDTHILYASEMVIVPCDWIEQPMLGHLGGHKFFLLHESSNGKPKAGQLMHCLKFSVDLVKARERINVSLESSQSLIKRPGRMSNGCVVMSSQNQRDFLK
ncbi:hypothetical protein Tsubulata_028082 [Turnera subulata]|uniref:Uncharacterized protein n=1 Tax=Turnera subulata TaxID=218843 RepID=A0A9Q0GIT3_9ROSI|nr:hypothetical protein Tsubulata_028082 [Turnera subulata]